MALSLRNLRSFPLSYQYLVEHYGNIVDSYIDYPIVIVPADLWTRSHLSGYAYLIDRNSFIDNIQFLESALKVKFIYDTLPTKDHKRDVNLYRIYRNIGYKDAIVLRENNSSAMDVTVVHEIAHLLFHTVGNSGEEFDKMSFNDDYLDSPTEQFSHLNEIRMAIKLGWTFDQYFERSHTDEYDIIKKYESGDGSETRERYELSMMDRRDYKKMWEYISNKFFGPKAYNTTSLKRKSFNLKKVKIASKILTIENLKGKYGVFPAYVVKGSDTRLISHTLKALGFKWWPYLSLWYLPTKHYNVSIENKLKDAGVTSELFGAGSTNETSINPVPSAKPETHIDSQESPSSVSNSMTQENVVEPKKAPKHWVTEDPSLTKWYGFPINHGIYEFDMNVNIEGEEHQIHCVVDRIHIPGKDGRTKSMQYKGFPRYFIHITDAATGTPIKDTGITSKRIYGTYDEEEYVSTFPEILNRSIESKKSIWIALSSHYDSLKRDPEVSKFLEHDFNNTNPDREFTIHILRPAEYAGDYPVIVDYLGLVKTDLQKTNPKAPYPDIIGSVDFYGIHNMQQLKQMVDSYLTTEKPQAEYVKYLQSFPFLEEQQQQASLDYSTIMSYLNGSYNIDSVITELLDRGFIRPHKRQKQQEGLSERGDIKWVVDSKKIVDSVYGYSYDKETPNFFYSVLAYYIHRKIRGIFSWTEMMLGDSMRVWANVMNRYGAETSAREAELIIEKMGREIIALLFSDARIREDSWRRFNDWMNGESRRDQSRQPNGDLADQAIIDFDTFAKQNGVVDNNIEDNLKSVYKQLAHLLHPDKFSDPQQKLRAEEQFKKMQNLWEEIPIQYKEASGFYNLSWKIA